MSRPEVSPTALELWTSLGPYRLGDSDDNDWALLRIAEALCQAFVEPVAELVSERNGMASWEVLFSPADCPAAYLPWLAQWTGSTLSDSMTEAEKRAAITLPSGWRRGTYDALEQAVQRTLTGTKHVVIIERDGGAYRLTVRTQTAETPDPAATLAAVLSQKPVGLVADVDDITGATYAEVDAAYTDYADVEASVSDYAELLLLT